GDYHQIIKGGGHGNYRTLVLAPSTVQEMADLTALAFELADEYRTPVVVLADGYIGQMMEPVEFSARVIKAPKKNWAVEGTAATRKNLVTSIYLSPDELEGQVQRLEAKYRRAEQHEVRAECYRTDDAEIILIGYGIVARILKSVVEQARAQGLPVGLLRPISLYPFPVAPLLEVGRRAQLFLVVELSTGQLLDDVRLTLQGHAPIEFYGRTGGNVPSAEEILAVLLEKAERHLGVAAQEGSVLRG
ncbi:MAG: 3-methyl-2-oxobutanoate dehydrogenase subunit beta, partial [Nevskiales bacterium]